MKINPFKIIKTIGRIVPFDLMDIKIDGKMDNEKRKQSAGSIVRNHIIWSMGTGLIPIPFVDFFAVSAVQLDMVRQLSKLYKVDFKDTEGKAVITSLTGSGLAQLGSRAAIKFIPGIGSIVGGITMSVLSGASTYALGEIFKEHFETGGTFLDFDPGRLKKYYQEKFEKGKQVAKDIQEEEKRKEKDGTGGGFSFWKKKSAKKETVNEESVVEDPAVEDPITEEPTKKEPIKEETPVETNPIASQQDKILVKIRELAKLREEGILSDEEFQQMKIKVLEKF